MANIGATTAFYKVETSLTRANNEVSKSMERLATGKQNANAGDRSSYVAMSDTFRLDYVGTKAGIKSASVAMGYLETGMRVLDSASSLMSRLQELAVLGANNTNTTADNEAINLEAEAIADEFNRLMATSTYKGKNVFTTAAGDQELAMGGRGAEMTFGIGAIDYSALYSSSNRTIDGEPNNGETFNLTHLPSDAIVAKSYGGAVTENNAEAADVTLAAGKKYVIRGVDSTDEVTLANSDTNSPSAGAVSTAISNTYLTMTNSSGTAVSTTLESGNVLNVTTASTIDRATAAGSVKTLSTISSIDGALVSASVDDGLTFLAGSKTDGDRTAGTYTISAAQFTSGTNGAGATFTVVIDDDGEAFVTVTGAGSLFADAETITIANSVLGAGSDGATNAAADLVFTIDDVTATADRDESSTFSITSDDYTVYDSSGNVKTTATGATFTITTNASDEATVNLTYGGSGFAANDYIMIDGSTFSDSDNPSDLKIEWSAIDSTTLGTSVTFAEVRTGENAFQATDTYVIQNLGTVNTSGSISVADSDAEVISKAFTDVNGNALTGNLSVGQKIKFATLGDTIGTTTVTQEHLDAANALIEGMTFTKASDTLTADIEAIQSLLNRARVEAGSQYAALESAVSYTTDLTAQYELGFNTVNDVNFSAETAHLAKNQILQQAATAMLAQANSGQQGLLQLIQG